MVDGLGDDPSEGDEASEADSEPYVEGTSSPLEDGGASACDSEDFERSTPDRVSSCREVAGDDFGSSAGSERLLRSSSVSAMIAIRMPTLTLLEPSGCYTWQISLEVQGAVAHSPLTIILAICPSSCASTSIWALSVSISRSTSPVEKESPKGVLERSLL